MAQQAAESIAHFIGQFHIADLLSLPMRHYVGAGSMKIEGFTGTKAVRSDPFTQQTDLHTTSLQNIDMPLFGRSFYHFDERPIQPDHALPSLNAAENMFQLPQFRVGLQAGAAGTGTATITATYTEGQAQSSDVALRQTNMLVDRDTVLGMLEDPGEALLSARGELNFAATAAREAALDAVAHYGMNSGLQNELYGNAEGVTRQTIETKNGAPLPFPDLDDAVGDLATIVPVASGNGQFVDGVLTAAAGQSAQEQAADVLSAMERATSRSDSDFLRDVTGEDGEPASNTSEPHAFTFVPDSVVPAEVATGQNAATNVAMINDFNSATASRVVIGDYHATTAIVQVNVFAPVESNLLSSPASLTPQTMIGLNDGRWLADPSSTTVAELASLRNEASFFADPGPLVGMIGVGGPGALAWNVDYVNGDFYDITTILQRNYSDDGDLVATQVSDARYIVSSGDNDQINLAQLSDLGSNYELIVVLGDWHEINAIFQFNILASDTIGTNHSLDMLENDAAISSVGGMTHNPLTDSVSALVDALADKTTQFDYSLAVGLPGNGDDHFDVLFVTGDYISENVIIQTNVLVDVDAQASENFLATAGDGSQGNALTNVALINNVDSLSAYQFVGGEIYEESTLIEANLIVDESGYAYETETTDNTIHPDVIAAIAAMGADDTGSEQHYSPANLSGLDGASQTDVLGGVIT